MKIEIIAGETIESYTGLKTVKAIRKYLKNKILDGAEFAFCVIENQKVSDMELQRMINFYSNIPVYGKAK